MAKTPGQIAYEAEVAAYPTYPKFIGGGPRKTWTELDDWQRSTWEEPIEEGLEMAKTPGQIAYEADVAEFPDYPTSVGGGPRPAWTEASGLVRVSWEREARRAVSCEKQWGKASSRKGG